MEFVQVVSVENMRKSDARTIAEHTPSAELMYRAAPVSYTHLTLPTT